MMFGMTLKEKLETDLSTAMKARDEVRTRTLRMALTAVKNEEVGEAVARAVGRRRRQGARPGGEEAARGGDGVR